MTTAIATYGVGLEAVAATAVHDNPTVTLTAPTGTVSSGGPNLTVSWTYAQAQSVVQAQYRAVVSDDSGDPVYYDTGWLTGAITSISIDALAGGIPSDTTSAALGVRVYVRSADGDTYQADTGLLTFAIQWGVVTVDATAPTGTIASTSPTATWTFASTRSFAELSYRVRLLYQASLVVLYDSGFIAGTATSYAVPYLLSDGSSYRVEVTAKNAMGVSGSDTIDFATDLPGSSDYTDEPAVGKVYEVGINGMGLMLYDNQAADPSYKYQRIVAPLEAQRLATSATPLSEAVERYLFSSSSDFKGGAGQSFADREASAADAFKDSDGVDPFNKFQLKLLNSTSLEVANTYASARFTVVGTVLYHQTGAKALASRTAPGAAGTAFSVAAAGTISSLTTDGVNWYAADGTNIWRNSTAADPGGAWSTIDAQYLGFAGGRICASYASSGSTPNVFTTLDDAGAEEITNGRIVLPVGWTIKGFTTGSGFVFFTAQNGDQGAIYSWDFTAAAPIVAWELPRGELPIAIRWSQGNVIVLARRSVGAVSKMGVYRCEVQQSFSLAGTLVPSLITVIGDTENPPAYDYGIDAASVAAYGRQVFFSWPEMGGATGSGIGCVDLSTSGFAKWHKSTAGGAVASIGVWQGRLIFLVRGSGIWVQSLTSYVSSGYVISSVVDGNSNLDKVLDTVTLTAFPLAASESVDVSYSIDGGNSFTALSAATLSGTGAKRKATDIDQRAANVALKVTLNGPGTSTPTLFNAAVRYHPFGLADLVLVLPIDCGDQVGGLNNTPLRENGPGRGAARARILEQLAQTRVSVQDIDWADTGNTETFEVVQCQTDKVSLYDRNKGKTALRMVCVMTLRRRLK